MEQYIKESADSLSAALGPRWSQKRLDEDAERNTQALLHSIGGGGSLRAINGMIGALGAVR